MSLLGIDEEDLKAKCSCIKRPGDICWIGSNRGQEYEILQIERGKAWVVRVKEQDQDQVVPLDRLKVVRPISQRPI